jgi:hypothetical protein
MQAPVSRPRRERRTSMMSGRIVVGPGCRVNRDFPRCSSTLVDFALSRVHLQSEVRSETFVLKCRNYAPQRTSSLRRA